MIVNQYILTHVHSPNIVMGANAQVALEKFARYFDVECRLVPISKDSHYRLDPQRAMQYVDENTIGVMVIMGSTYTGEFEDVQGMSNLRTWNLFFFCIRLMACFSRRVPNPHRD